MFSVEAVEALANLGVIADSWQLTLTLERRPLLSGVSHHPPTTKHKFEAVRTFKTMLLRYKKSSCGYDGDKVKNSLPMWKPCNSSKNTQRRINKPAKEPSNCNCICSASLTRVPCNHDHVLRICHSEQPGVIAKTPPLSIRQTRSPSQWQYIL